MWGRNEAGEHGTGYVDPTVGVSGPTHFQSLYSVKCYMSVNDEIIGCNGFRVNKSALDDLLAMAEVGDQYELLIARDQELYSVTIGVTPYEQPKFSYALSNDAKTQKLNDYWLRTIK